MDDRIELAAQRVADELAKKPFTEGERRAIAAIVAIGQSDTRPRAEDPEPPLPPTRWADGGCQVVEADGFAYRWQGDVALSVGDRVLLPENWLSKIKEGSGPYKATITKIGSRYRGELSTIIRRLDS